jgi:hypothetical protein
MEELNIEQLKAKAYDQLVTIEIAQANLRAINQAIAVKEQKEKKE